MSASVKRHLPDFKAITLAHVFHYRQTAGTQPNGGTKIPPCYERVEVMTGGRGWIRADGAWREVLPGDIIWNKPGDHTIGKSDDDAPYRCLAINLISKRKKGLGIPRFAHYPHLEEIKNFTEEVTRLARNENFDRLVLRDYVLSRLILWINIHKQEQNYRKLPAPLRMAVTWIEKNFTAGCRLGDIARIAGWSVPHLHEAFRTHLGQTPRQIVIAHRIRAARERLVAGTHPIKQIAVECGFYDAPALTHAFKAHVGLTPHAYRQRYVRLVIP